MGALHKARLAAAVEELTVIERQAGRYESDATDRESSLAFNLIRALSQNVRGIVEELTGEEVTP